MICPNCNTEVETGTAFCTNCGTKLQDVSKQTCTIKYEERCNNTARIITKEEIISQLEDNHDFRFSYFRDNKGNITSILISWVRT